MSGMLRIIDSPSLAERTTLQLGGRAIAEIEIPSAVALEQLPQALTQLGGQPLVLGFGSNFLVQDGTLPFVLLSPCFMTPPEVVFDDGATVHVRVGASVRLPRLLARLAVWGLSGLEGLAGIPGSVGGAIAMNAGSYGYETGTTLHSVTLFSPSKGLQTLSREMLTYSYRHFEPANVSEWFIVTEAIFALQRSTSNSIKTRMRIHHLQKKATQPVHAKSAGCVFKNPAVGISAGKLLDDAGMRGVSCGNMALSEIHANFLVNRGGGCSDDAFALLDMAKKRVQEYSGVTLEFEVRILSCV